MPEPRPEHTVGTEVASLQAALHVLAAEYVAAACGALLAVLAAAGRVWRAVPR